MDRKFKEIIKIHDEYINYINKGDFKKALKKNDIMYKKIFLMYLRERKEDRKLELKNSLEILVGDIENLVWSMYSNKNNQEGK